MLCGFIYNDFTTEIKEIDDEQIEKLCSESKYHSVGAEEYFIFTDRSIRCEDNYFHLADCTTALASELLRRYYTKK